MTRSFAATLVALVAIAAAPALEDGAVRTAASRRLADDVAVALEPSLAPIAASIYTPSSRLFAVGDLEPWLRELRRVAPQRTLVLAVDIRLAPDLAPLAAELGLRLVPDLGHAFSPWPRDPLTFGRAGDGRLAVLVRPNAQRGREADAHLGATLAAAFPADLDAAWGGLWWRPAAVPFHNGQVLLTEDAAWIGVHSVEPRVLELLGADAVPVAGFAGEDGRRYLAAVREAAGELAALYGRPVRLVHPLPDAGDADRAAALRRLGGGAGHDLDSLVTLLETPDGLVALVGDPRAGADLVAAAPAADLAAFAAGHGLAGDVATLRRRLAAAQASPRAASLAVFLDVVAAELARAARVARLPLLWVPRELEREPAGGDAGFLVGWQNVVLERREDAAGAALHRAEGFASLLPTGDALARRAYADAGYRLDLLPPLVASVVRGGGYRCASQHLREAAQSPSASKTGPSTTPVTARPRPP